MPSTKRKHSPVEQIDDLLLTKKPRLRNPKSVSPVPPPDPPRLITHHLPGVSVAPSTEPDNPPPRTLTLRIHGVDDRPTCQWHCPDQVNWLNTPDDHDPEKRAQCEACVYVPSKTTQARVVVWKSSDDDMPLYRVSRPNTRLIEATTDPILLEVELSRYPRRDDEYTSELWAHRALSVLVTSMRGMFVGKEVHLRFVPRPSEPVDESDFRLHQLLMFRSLRCRKLVVYMYDAPLRFPEVADRVVREVQGRFPSLDLFDLRLQMKKLPQVGSRARYRTDLEHFFVHIVRGDVAECRRSFQLILGEILDEYAQHRAELMDMYEALDHWIYEELDVVPAEDRGHGAPI